MKRLNNFLREEETEAKKQAIARGLEYRGFGYWADKNTGQVVARSSGDKLIDIEKPMEQGEGQGDEPTAPKGKGFADMMPPGGAPQQPVAMGKVLPGEEKAPKDEDDGNWTPGPDGDTDVGSDNKNEVEDDVFVDKDEDTDDWVAGPDGSNFKNFKSFDKMQEAVLTEWDWTGKSQGVPLLGDSQAQSAAEVAKRRGYTSDGHGYWMDQSGNIVGKTVNGKFVEVSPDEAKRAELGSKMPGRTTMRDMLKGKREVGGPMAAEIGAAKDAAANLSPSERDAYLDKMAATKDGTYRKGADKGHYDKAVDMQKNMANASRMDALKFKRLKDWNEEVKQYVADPNYDLSDDNLGEELGDGAFGQVHLEAAGENVIKDGMIGQNEVQALDLLKDIPGFPRIINTRFDGEFESEEDREGSTGASFWDQAVSAPGRFAMTLADGQPIGDAAYGWDDISAETAASNFWNTMAAMHKAGVAHNDLHGGNIFFNDELEPTILDLGLATVDKLAALMEGLASQNDNNYQLNDYVGMHQLPQETIDQLEANRQELIDTIAEDYSGDEWEDDTREMWSDIIEGDIRITRDALTDFRYQLDLDEDQLQKYIDILYQGIEAPEEPVDERSELEQRMDKGYQGMLDKIAKGAGYRDGEGMKGIFNAANNMKKERGEGSIPFKGVDITRQ